LKRLGVDLDGVVCDFVKSFFKISNRLYGTDYETQETWDFGDKYDAAQVDRVWEEIKRTKDWWQTLTPLPGTNALRYPLPGIEPVFITSRIPTYGRSPREQSCAWLREHFYITYPFVLVVDNPSQKVPLVKDLGIQAFIDDKRSTVLQMHDAGIRSYVQLQPYNCSEPFPEGVVCVESLNEFLKEETKIG